MRALLFLVVVAACNDEIAIEVVIPPDSLSTRVELFLAFGPPCEGDFDQDGVVEPCPGVGPPTDMPFAGRLVLPGEVFHVDSTRPFIATVEDGAAWFTVDSADVELPVVIAVGTGPSGPDSVAIARQLSIVERPQHIRINLVPAGASLTDPIPVGDNVVIWPDRSPDRDQDIDTCVGAEFAGARVFIVPESNPDCDNVQPVDECNKLVFDAEEVAKPVALGDSKCSFEEDLTGPGTQVCLLGGQVCNEVEGGGIGCANTSVVCAPNHLCASCPRLEEESCVEDAFALDADPAPLVSHVRCNVEVEVDQAAGRSRPCRSQSTTATIGGLCTAVRLSLLQFPFNAFATQLNVDTGNGLEVQLAAATAENPCGFILKHGGELPLVASELPDLGLWTEFQTATTTVMLPLVIHWIPVSIAGCAITGASTCDFVPAPNDNVKLCFEL